MSEDRLTPLDASFLHLEEAASHMHVACVMIFEGDPPPYDHLVGTVEERLHLVPRYRQKLATVPLGQARPKWIDDPGFDARYHIRVSSLPRPGSEYELQVLAGRVFSQRLNRDKPRWEIWLVEGLEGNRFAMLSKTHHALVDGISGLDILSVLFAPEQEADEHEQWTPRPAPSQMGLLTEALWERTTRPAELMRPVRALLRRPRQVLRTVVETAVGVGAMAWAGLQPAPHTPYNDHIVGSDRRFVWVRGSLQDVKEIKNSLGGTVNDVMLTIVARALRRHLIRRELDVEGLVLKAFVPVSVRAEDQRGTLGNQVSGLVAPLPVGCANAADCMGQIGEAMRDIKESGQAVGAQALTELGGFAPPTLLTQAGRLIARQRFINLVVTNVPGPQSALNFEGRELLDIFPMGPLGTNLGLGVAILSYHGTINFGLVGDFDAMPDLEDLADDFTAAIHELAEAAGVNVRSVQRGSTGAEASATSADANGHVNGNGRGNVVSLPPPRRRRVRGEDRRARAGSRTGPSAAETARRGDAKTPSGATGPPASAAAGGPEAELVAESAEPAAQRGAGARLRVREPWSGYGRMKAADIVDRLAGADEQLVAMVSLYETRHRGRRRVLAATERALKA